MVSKLLLLLPFMEEVYKIQLCKEKLERQLQVARNQIARLQNDSIANE